MKICEHCQLNPARAGRFCRPCHDHREAVMIGAGLAIVFHVGVLLIILFIK